MSLRDWLANRWLVEHQTSRQEIADLLAIADRDLADSTVPGLSDDRQFGIAYNAALQVATAALAAEGYRASRERHHERVLQSLAYTLELKAESVTQLDHFRRKRNVGWYERVGATSEHEVQAMRGLAAQLRARMVDWLRERHPELL